MLQLIFQWLMSALAQGIELIINLFMNALDMDVSTYVELFPFLSTGYTIFRGVGIGLAIVLSSLSLLKFLVPALFGAEKPTDTVPGVLLKTFAAGGLIYGGNYILVKIVNIAKIPYNIFLDADAAGTTSSDFSWDFLARLLETFTGAEAAYVVLEFFLVVVISYNLLKLMVEVCERYMIVGIMVYTSPPFFAMCASSDTMINFKNWLKMFISACAMMAVSVFFLKLILSGFAVMNSGLTDSGAFMLVRLFLLLATCKIAQRVDSYLSQIGLGTAKTGGNLLGDALAGLKGMKILGGSGSVSSQSGGSRGSHVVLGAAAAAMSRNGGIAGKVTDTVRAGMNSYASGDGRDEILKKAADAFHRSSMVPNSVKAPADIIKSAKGAENLGDAVSKMSRTAGEKIMGSDSDAISLTNTGAQRKASLEENEALRTQSAYDTETDNTVAAMEARESLNDSVKQNIVENAKTDLEFAAAASPDVFTPEIAKAYTEEFAPSATGSKAIENYNTFGSIDPDTGASMQVNSEGVIEPLPRAKAAGVSIQASDSAIHTGQIFSGSPSAVADIIAGGYNPQDAFIGGAPSEDYRDTFEGMAIDTISSGSPEIADRLLHNPNMDIGGYKGENIGSAAISRLYPDLVSDNSVISNVESFSYPASTNSQGQTMYGGHGWTATISDGETGYKYTSIDRTAYSTLDAEQRSLYTRRDLPTGRIEYIKREELSSSEMEAQGETVIIHHAHYSRIAPSRVKNSNGNTSPTYRSKTDVIDIPDTREDIKKYVESRKKTRPVLPSERNSRWKKR